MVDQKQEVRKIPVVQLAPGEMEAELQTKIREFEQRYERPSEQMLQLLTWGEVKETAEILEWMFDYHVLKRLLREETPTTGIPTTTTEQSTKNT